MDPLNIDEHQRENWIRSVGQLKRSSVATISFIIADTLTNLFSMTNELLQYNWIIYVPLNCFSVTTELLFTTEQIQYNWTLVNNWTDSVQQLKSLSTNEH